MLRQAVLILTGILLLISPSRADTVHIPLLFKPAAAPTPQPVAHIVIAALIYEGRDEQVLVRNEGSAAQDLNGWRLHSLPDQWFSFPTGYVLQPGASVRVHSGPDAVHAPPGDLLWTRQYIWNNEADAATLYNDRAEIVDQWSYGS
ncbi:MAG: lamin tail domain-containing protein [Chloroflexi bacterium]|nr:lamin tail domain-containing protein [Chloroflexota bacterium]